MPGPYPTSIVGQFLVGDGHVVGGSLMPAAGGVTSAQAFGVPLFSFGVQYIPIPGVPSAQRFSTLYLRITRSVGGVSSAQAFGVFVTRQTVTVQGITNGVNSPLLNTFLCGQRNVGASQFGKLSFRTTVTFPIGVGVPSAQNFGTPFAFGGPIWFPLGVGVPSAQAFGKPIVFVVYLRPEDCDDLDLAALVCVDFTLVESDSISLDLEPVGV